MLQRIKEEHFLLVIIIIAAILRFYNITGMSLMNDELSALSRTHYSSFNELIQKGVAFEGHPAGVQVFLNYWVKIFGDGVFMVRLPFVLCGIFSVYLIYKTGASWFNKNSGLYAAASLAILEFPVLYSQLARMYSAGLFTTLLFCLCWTRLFMRPEPDSPRRKLLSTVYVLAGAASLYTHYFAFMLIVIIIFSGLFFISKSLLKKYLLLNILIALLFVPHIKLFFVQLAQGGLAWLPKPDSGTFFQYFKNFFNDSRLYLVFTGILVIAFIVNPGKTSFTKFHFFSILFFIVSYFAGYFYSITRNPVLQLSCMLFSFPYLLLFIFSFQAWSFNSLEKIFLITFIVLLLYSIIIEKKYYRTYHFGEFKELADLTISFNKKSGSENITRIINVQNPQYLKYYFDKDHEPMDVAMTNIANDSTCAALMHLIAACKTPCLSYAFTNVQNPPEALQVIQSFYPFTVFKKDMFNSGFYLFARQKEKGYLSQQYLYEFIHDFEKPLFNDDSMFITASNFFSPNHCADISNSEYGPTFEKKLNEINYHEGTTVNASVKGFDKDKIKDAFLVVTVMYKDSVYKWVGSDLHYWINETNRWLPAYASLQLPVELTGEELLKVYVWNSGRNKLLIDDLKITLTKTTDYYKKEILK